MRTLHKDLKELGMPLTSANTYTRGILGLGKEIIDEAFRKHNVALCFKRNQMKPFNQRDILIKCPFLRNLPIEAMDKVYEVNENVLVPLYAEEGEVDDDVFEEHLGHILGPPARGSSLAEDRIPIIYGEWCQKNSTTSILRFKKTTNNTDTSSGDKTVWHEDGFNSDDEEDLSEDINADDIEENVSNDEENDDDDRNKKRSHDEPETNTPRLPPIEKKSVSYSQQLQNLPVCDSTIVQRQLDSRKTKAPKKAKKMLSDYAVDRRRAIIVTNPNFLQRLRENEALKAAESLNKKNKRAKSSEINGIKINSMLKPKLIKELKKLNLSSEGNVAELKLRLTNYIDSEKNDNTHDDDKNDNEMNNI